MIVKRVLHVINGELYSGAERVQDLLALGLGEFGYEVGFACVKPGQFPGRRRARDAALHLVPMRSRFDLLSAAQLARVIAGGEYELVHTHTPRAAFVGRLASWRAGVPMVHHVHSPTARDTENAVRNRVNTFVERLSLVGVRALVPVSSSLETYLVGQGFAQSRIFMVANGVSTPDSLPAAPALAAQWVVGCVALFRPRKGIEVLLEALAELRNQGKAVRLLAVGPFETEAYECQVKGLAGRLGIANAIEWTGFTEDVAAQLARMHLFVLPSLFGEGMPMVILEAMANGVPVVASRVEGIPEVIEDRRTGVLVEPADAAALAAALGDLVDGKLDKDRIRQHAYRHQADNFSDRSMARGVAEVYNQVLGDG